MANGVGVVSHGCSGAHDLSKRLAGYFATTTALATLPPKLRVHGQMAIVGQSIYVFDENATVGGVTPGAGTGRWILGGGGAGGARPPILVARNMTTGALGAYTRTGNTILADANGAVGAIDGVTNVAGDVLFLNTGAAAAADVGLYVFESVGAAGAKYQMTRIPEFDSSAEVVPGTLVVVTEGTANADTMYVLNTNAPITLNTTSLAFTAVPNYVDLLAAGGAALIGLTDTNSKITGTTLQALVDELTTTTGGAMVGIADAGSHFTGTDAEAALQEVGLIRIRKLQLQITHADLTNAVNGAADTINIGSALPANAWVLGRPDVLLTTQFTGGSATEVDLDIGVAGAIKSLLGDLDVLASTASGAHYNIGDAAGTREGGYFGGSQLIATFTPDGSHDLADLDAGDLTITVLYVVMA
jgi:hypothetical protein